MDSQAMGIKITVGTMTYPRILISGSSSNRSVVDISILHSSLLRDMSIQWVVMCMGHWEGGRRG